MMSDTKKIVLPVVGSEAPSEAPAPRTRQDGGDVMSEIAHEVAAHKVVLYMKGTPDSPMCGFSARAAQIMAAHGVTPYAVNILEDQAKRQAIKEYSEWPTIPQVYVDGEFLGGSDILAQMHESGELARVLGSA